MKRLSAVCTLIISMSILAMCSKSKSTFAVKNLKNQALNLSEVTKPRQRLDFSSFHFAEFVEMTYGVLS